MGSIGITKEMVSKMLESRFIISQFGSFHRSIYRVNPFCVFEDWSISFSKISSRDAGIKRSGYLTCHDREKQEKEKDRYVVKSKVYGLV